MLASLEQWRDALRAGDEPHLEALLTRAHTLREGLNQVSTPPSPPDPLSQQEMGS